MELRRGYKLTEVGVVPDEWDVNKLENYFSYISYGFTNPMPMVKNGIFLITAANIFDGKIQYDTARCTTNEAYNYLLTQKSKPKINDILLTKDGSLGRLAIVDNENICINQSVAVIRPNGKILPLFLKKLLESEYYQKVIIDNAGGSTIKHIYITRINLMQIAVPKSLMEQTLIATALSDADALISSLEKLIDKKRKINQGVMQRLLKPKKSWEVEPIKNIALIATGTKNTQDKIENGTYPFFVRSPNIERINSYSFDGEAILVAGDGVGTGKVMHYFNGKFNFHQRVYKISNFQNNINGFYFYLYFKNNFYDRIMQMTAKSSVDSIRMDMIANMSIYFPAIEEQINIANVLTNMNLEIINLESKLSKLRQIKSGMMQNLLTGKIRLVKKDELLVEEKRQY